MAMFLNGCAFYYSRPITNGLNSGRIRMDMDTTSIKREAGIPAKIAVRKISANDTRQVWVYNEYSPSMMQFLFGFLTFGLIWFDLPPPTQKTLVFQNDLLVGVDLPDPTAPNFILEKRER